MRFKQAIRRLAQHAGYDIVKRTDIAASLDTCEAFPTGHFYSAIPSRSDVTSRASAIFSKTPNLAGIDLNSEKQIVILQEFRLMNEIPPFYSKQGNTRFDIENDSFSYDDAPILHFMMRLLRPKRVIEIGSGNSSACMLDTSEFFLGESIEFTFIDPYCDNLRRVLLEKDLTRVTILEKPIQSVDRSIFSVLQANDILFVDSSHVMKVGSDLQTIFFEILPCLSPGVCIHFHDVRYPFEYQKSMVMNGVFWNEAYVLRAFLMDNAKYEITFWLNYLINANLPQVNDLLSFLPLKEWDRRFNKNSNDFSEAGGSIYLTKKA